MRNQQINNNSKIKHGIIRTFRTMTEAIAHMQGYMYLLVTREMPYKSNQLVLPESIRADRLHIVDKNHLDDHELEGVTFDEVGGKFVIMVKYSDCNSVDLQDWIYLDRFLQLHCHTRGYSIFMNHKSAYKLFDKYYDATVIEIPEIEQTYEVQYVDIIRTSELRREYPTFCTKDYVLPKIAKYAVIVALSNLNEFGEYKTPEIKLLSELLNMYPKMQVHDCIYR